MNSKEMGSAETILQELLHEGIVRLDGETYIGTATRANYVDGSYEVELGYTYEMMALYRHLLANPSPKDW